IHSCQPCFGPHLRRYVFFCDKGYQDTDTVISSVTTKVKGIALTNTSDLGLRIWDAADYVIPAQVASRREEEESSFFVLTNLIITPNQTQSCCAENPGPRSSCSTDQDCEKGLVNKHKTGMQTGRCIQFSASEKTCEVLAWCPLEKEANPPDPPLLAEAEKFTVLIKNGIHYPKFHFRKRNILPHVNSSYLSQCVFNRTTDPDCPIFRLGDIASEAGEDFQTMAVHGGVMGVQIRWDCDLDWPESWCVPTYTFRRLDNKDLKNNVTTGYNFRFAKYYKNERGQESRTLFKGYGIRFDIKVFGTGRKSSALPILLNLGASLGLLGTVSINLENVYKVLKLCGKNISIIFQKYFYIMKYKYISFLFNTNSVTECCI
uniref:P2X purinoceptor n=1 Tax=Electrophorus electricus TaxID=8005 RepID=A0A4W4GTP1_ELEEL